MEPIEQEFLSNGVLRDGLLLLSSKDALAMVRRCRELGIKVLGIDGFRLTEQTIQPVMEESIDTSKACNKLDTWIRAEAFLIAHVNTDLFFEVVV
jgi:hypothetical protein